MKREIEVAEEREGNRAKEGEAVADMNRMKKGKSVGLEDLPAEA